MQKKEKEKKEKQGKEKVINVQEEYLGSSARERSEDLGAMAEKDDWRSIEGNRRGQRRLLNCGKRIKIHD